VNIRFLGNFSLIPPLLIEGDQTISIPSNCAVFKFVIISYRNFVWKWRGPPFLLKLHTALCYKHINNFKCIRLSILRFSFSKIGAIFAQITCAAILQYILEEIKQKVEGRVHYISMQVVMNKCCLLSPEKKIWRRSVM